MGSVLRRKENGEKKVPKFLTERKILNPATFQLSSNDMAISDDCSRTLDEDDEYCNLGLWRRLILLGFGPEGPKVGLD